MKSYLVDEDDNVLNADLLSKQEMLPSLGHGAVSGSDNEYGTVHLRSASYHVLDVVSVARAVGVRVVAVVGGVLDVGNVDGDATLAFLGRVVDVRVRLGLSELLVGQD